MAQATLIIDIETVGQDLDAIPSRALEILMAPSAAASAAEAEGKPDVAEAERQKVLDGLGLDPCTGRIICIGLHWMELDRSRVYCQPEERELLANFWADLGQIRPQRLVTFNGKSFDFPYINVRSAILGIPIPGGMFLDTRRFSTDRHFDVREILSNFNPYKKGTLEFYCEIFGVPSPKDGISGSKVGEFYKAGKLDEIARYCLADCKATGELFLKIKNYYR